MSEPLPGADARTVAESDAGASSAEPRVFLVVYEGARSRVVDLEEGYPVTMGRSQEAVVPLDDAKASRLHARVEAAGTDVFVDDLGSTNGTRLNGERITARARLRPGDEIAIGGARIVLGAIAPRAGTARVGGIGDLEERLGAELDRARRYRRALGLAMIRIDGSGRAAALVRMLGGVRRMDFVAEYSPDEYGVVLPECARAAADAAARRLAELAMARKDGGSARVSFGAACYPGDADGVGELIERARAALRAARRGRAGPAGEAPLRPDAARRTLFVDAAMQRVRVLAKRIAPTPATVLILGETGSGKEVLAEEIHAASGRAGPFLRVNCAALHESLLESELFGHERGAFTGAERRHAGYFEAASTGTLLLDEVGDLPPGTQAKLLRVLETREVTRVGGTEPVPVDVRVVAATHRDLETLVGDGRFREDLYFRLAAFVLYVPPLRERRAEISPLARLFAEEIGESLGQRPPDLTRELIAKLEAYPWPGNVRELRNAVERAVVLSGGGRIDPAHLPERVVAGVAPEARPAPGIRARLDSIERQGILEALAACSQNQTKAARMLGLSRRALIYKMRKYGLGRTREE